MFNFLSVFITISIALLVNDILVDLQKMKILSCDE